LAELNLPLQPNYRAAPFNVTHLMVQDENTLNAICRRHALRIIKGVQNRIMV
jgi:hypothetical protein